MIYVCISMIYVCLYAQLYTHMYIYIYVVPQIYLFLVFTGIYVVLHFFTFLQILDF